MLANRTIYWIVTNPVDSVTRHLNNLAW